MMNWLNQHGGAFLLTLRQFARQPVGTMLNTVVIGIGLAMPLCGHLLLTNLKTLTGGVAVEPQISVFLAPDAGPADRDEIERRLKSLPAVSAYRYVSRDAALRELSARIGSADLLAGLDANPLPDGFVVVPRDGSTDAQSGLAGQLRGWPKVAEVDADAAWSERLRALTAAGETIVLSAGILLGMAMLAVTFNTIRLQVLTRAEEITVLGLFGATSGYIRRPFLYFGGIQGLFAALFAWALSALLLRSLEAGFGAVLATHGMPSRLAGLSWPDGLALVAFSTAVGALGAWLASREHGRTPAGGG
jgi:cell division transport system permease protein